MRRDKTLKVCANHLSKKRGNSACGGVVTGTLLVTTDMELKPNVGSDRAWVWNVPADFAEETPRPELLAIRFGNAESEGKEMRAYLSSIMECLLFFRCAEIQSRIR